MCVPLVYALCAVCGHVLRVGPDPWSGSPDLDALALVAKERPVVVLKEMNLVAPTRHTSDDWSRLVRNLCAVRVLHTLTVSRIFATCQGLYTTVAKFLFALFSASSDPTTKPRTGTDSTPRLTRLSWHQVSFF